MVNISSKRQTAGQPGRNGLITCAFYQTTRNSTPIQPATVKKLERVQQENPAIMPPQVVAEKYLDAIWYGEDLQKEIGEDLQKEIFHLDKKGSFDQGRGLVPPQGKTAAQFFSGKNIELTKTQLVKFRQRYKNVPVYGSLITVELSENNELVSLNSSVGVPKGIDPSPKIKDSQISKKISELTGSELHIKDLNSSLYYYFDSNNGKWRLVYIVKINYSKIIDQGISNLGMLDYVIDAHSGEKVDEFPRFKSLR